MLKRILAILVLLLSIRGGIAYAEKVYIAKESVLSKQEEILTTTFSDQLVKKLNRPGTAIISANTDTRYIEMEGGVIVALGAGALQEALGAETGATIIAVFISHDAYQSVVANHKGEGKVTAIYSDPSPRRQVALVKALLGEGASLGVIRSDSIREEVNEVLTAAKEFGVRVEVVDLEKHRNPKSIIDEIRDKRTLLVIKNKELFGAISLDDLVVLAYDIHNLGIIGYSRGVVNNGALATTYASMDDTVDSVATLIHKILVTGQVPAPGYSDQYSVAINKYVLRSLNIYEQNQKELKNKIEFMPGEGLR